ncbi:beta-1,6-N-acetylglucosaminyltransferase [Gemella cuniculi]|uniref:beta-1,6-N-acetylglucosaminyltransferase n=1 Tax=Gemella cuniculi TaxID=150240 RepID=UPI00042A1472|nr:beta-1,6-N-acetylglucosaminyltransferase [Gemella cuniculi]
MKKHAYLIIAHNKIEQLKFLISLLDYEKHDIFILFDKKSNILKQSKEDIMASVKYSKILFTKEIPIYWGDYSQIEAELELFKAAKINEDYEFYHLLSGVDLPLDTAENIYNFFEENKEKNFINISPKEIFERAKAHHRIKYYYYFTKIINRREIDNKFIKKLFSLYRKIEKFIQKILRVDRLKKDTIIVKYGSNWCSINKKAVNSLLSNEDFISKTFKCSWLADELFIPTTLGRVGELNDLYLYNSSDDFQGNLRYIN